MPTLHAIIRTDLCEETIVETYAKAEDAAAFIERQPDGAPFRIAVLTEAVEPTREDLETVLRAVVERDDLALIENSNIRLVEDDGRFGLMLRGDLCWEHRSFADVVAHAAAMVRMDAAEREG